MRHSKRNIKGSGMPKQEPYVPWTEDVFLSFKDVLIMIDIKKKYVILCTIE